MTGLRQPTTAPTTPSPSPSRMNWLVCWNTPISISYPSSTEVTVKNHANLSGLVEKWVDTHVVNYDSSATVRFSKFDLNKVDSNDYLVTLPGATFQLAKWNSTTKKFEEVRKLTTDAAGQINFGLPDSSATGRALHCEQRPCCFAGIACSCTVYVKTVCPHRLCAWQEPDLPAVGCIFQHKAR